MTARRAGITPRLFSLAQFSVVNSVVEDDDCGVDVRPLRLERPSGQVDPPATHLAQLLALARAVGADRDQPAAGGQEREVVLDVVDVRAVVKWRVHHDAVELAEVFPEGLEIRALAPPHHARQSGRELGVDLDGGDVGLLVGLLDRADEPLGSGVIGSVSCITW
jgi:hypothetical protein